MRDALRSCLQIAGGLTEATCRRAGETAQGLLGQVGVDVDELRRKAGEAAPPELRRLADELVETGRANRDRVVELVREEADRTMARVGRFADDLTKVGVILEVLERKVRSLGEESPAETEPEGEPEARMTPGKPVSAPAPAPAPVREHVPVEEEPPPAPPAKKAPAKAAAKKTAAKKTPAKKTAAKKAPAARKAPARKPPQEGGHD